MFLLRLKRLLCLLCSFILVKVDESASESKFFLIALQYYYY